MVETDSTPVAESPASVCDDRSTNYRSSPSMASTTTFGDFPGVKVQTVGNAVTGVIVGRRQTLVLFGPVPESEFDGSAKYNEPYTFQTRRGPSKKLGDSRLATACEQAFGNGTPVDMVYAVPVEPVEVTGETHSGVSQFTLDNNPIDPDSVSITDEIEAGSVDAVISHADGTAAGAGLSQPSSTNTAHVDPNTGAVYADESSDYGVDYTYYDFATAINANTTLVDVGETAVMGAVTDSHDVAMELSSAVNTMRADYRMVKGVAGAQPNMNGGDSNLPYIDVSLFENPLDNDSMFLPGPVRTGDSGGGYGVGAVAGQMASAALEESIYNASLTNVDLTQRLTPGEIDTFADKLTIPLEERGGVRMLRNQSTSSASGYPRDYFVRRIIDQTVLIAREIGDSIVGRINDEETRDTAENQVRAELENLAASGLIEPNGDEENFYVDFFEDGASDVGVELGITPNGIVKRIDTTLTIAV